MSLLTFKRVDNTLPVPQYATEGSVGLDCYCREDVDIAPGSTALIPLNVIMLAPETTFIALLPRSSTLKKTGLILGNSVGVIDRDYAGENDEIKALVYNVTNQTIGIKRGDRYFQLVVINCEKPKLIELDHAPLQSDRGGFGSTGA